MNLRSLRPAGVFVAVFFSALSLAAQAPKRPIKHSDFDAWRTIASPVVSRDGHWLAYSFMPLDADGDVVVRELATGREQRVPVGTLPPPPIPVAEENANPEAPPVPRLVRIVFTSDSKFAVASTYPAKADVLAARKAKKEAPKGGLVIVNLATGDVMRTADVKNFQVPAKGGSWLAYLKEAKADEKKPDAATSAEKPAEPDDDTEDQQRGGGRAGAATSVAAGGAKVYGTDLVLRDLAAGAERVLSNAVDYSFARDGKALLFTVAAKTETENGVYAVAPADAGAPKALLAGKGKYVKLAWDREQAQLAFVSDRDDAAARLPKFKTYLWPRGAAAATEIVSAEIAGFSRDLVVSDKGVVGFSRDGKKLYVPAAPPPKPSARPAPRRPTRTKSPPISGAGTTTTCSRCKKSARSPSATAPTAANSISRRSTTRSSPTPRFSKSRSATTARARSASTTVLIAKTPTSPAASPTITSSTR